MIAKPYKDNESGMVGVRPAWLGAVAEHIALQEIGRDDLLLMSGPPVSSQEAYPDGDRACGRLESAPRPRPRKPDSGAQVSCQVGVPASGQNSMTNVSGAVAFSVTQRDHRARFYLRRLPHSAEQVWVAAAQRSAAATPYANGKDRKPH
jgi:hypothetical protein